MNYSDLENIKQNIKKVAGKQIADVTCTWNAILCKFS